MSDEITARLRKEYADDQAWQLASPRGLLDNVRTHVARRHRQRVQLTVGAVTVVLAVGTGTAVALSHNPPTTGVAGPVPSSTAPHTAVHTTDVPQIFVSPAADDRGVLARADWWTVSEHGGDPTSKKYSAEGFETWSYLRSGGVVQLTSLDRIRRPSPFWVGDHLYDWAKLQTLPTNAAALRALLGHIPHRSVASATATVIYNLAEMPVPRPAREAVVTLATELPGAVVTPSVRDSLGRPALHVQVQDADYRHVVDEYFFDPSTSRLLELDVHPSAGFTAAATGITPSRQTYEGWTTKAPPGDITHLPLVPWVTPFPKQ